MNRYRCYIQGMTLYYELGYYYAESPDDARMQAWNKHKSAFRDCGFSMVRAVKEN